MKILLKVDSRSKDFHFAKHFGNVSEFPTEFLVKESGTDAIQPVGDVKCTCYTCTDIAKDRDDVEYDINDLFNRIPHNMFGASPQDALKETVSGGLLPIKKV